MGRYVDEILQPGERVLYSTNEHWMFFLPAIAAWIVAVAFLVLWRLVTGDALMLFCLALAAVVGLAALYWTATAWFHRWTTETDVTNMRVVHKTGFIKRFLDRFLDTRRHFCAVLLGMCFAKMQTNLVSSFDVWSNWADAIASIRSRCASN